MDPLREKFRGFIPWNPNLYRISLKEDNINAIRRKSQKDN